MKNKTFIYRGFEIVQNPNSFNIYHENDKLLKIIPLEEPFYSDAFHKYSELAQISLMPIDNNKSIKLVETFIDEHLRKEN